MLQPAENLGLVFEETFSEACELPVESQGRRVAGGTQDLIAAGSWTLLVNQRRLACGCGFISISWLVWIGPTTLPFGSTL